ncbi:hypothetical protein A2303_07900 [Candidatus Falkowbacteria bacterium RIFOXYB2_FULL_47_14]|uniref:Uncharacterized protein n=1 Tax=Candidatus Falkowbacteria bacterium RIFOXYA2_FULL_47_19 TaxID=1797994 RepID=A0A1F5SN36_9BACT|nr:MAG: hypothetical protein A2227_05045 [Candidatus Falkowbacteria bacterium RIFOXYA2_FULL_47_19]OGF36048.1 MAG: hypothetical protein A2468_00750 [Candidatus Falkowbacteria bacterium RIFOXYC2_FULL_46_15]OGF43438.1 MAG: hypothetical protein A2303_07900 [Candidatus Falkowbacteria bacterium RIFOXYB2_FULL_47_14]
MENESTTTCDREWVLEKALAAKVELAKARELLIPSCMEIIKSWSFWKRLEWLCFPCTEKMVENRRFPCTEKMVKNFGFYMWPEYALWLRESHLAELIYLAENACDGTVAVTGAGMHALKFNADSFIKHRFAD